VTYEYAGCLMPESDGDDGSYAEPVSSCSDCGALVKKWSEENHTAWHREETYHREQVEL
jgi:hypothetical protein